MKLKRCATCKDKKPLLAFGRNRQAPDGLHYYCKVCAALRRRDWAANNKKKVTAAKQKYVNRIRARNDARVSPYE